MTKYEIVDAIIATKYPFISHHFFFSYLLLAIQFHSDVSRKSRTMCGVMCAKLAHDQSRMCTTPFNWDEQQREKTEDTLTEYSYILHVCAWNRPVLALKMSDVFFIIYFVIDFTPSIIRLGSILVTGLIDSSSQSKPQATAQTTVIINCHCVIIMFIMCCACARACSDAN